jgi:Zn-dependent alcohol dehydrogenase
MIPYLIEQHSLGYFPLEEIVKYYDIEDFNSAFEDIKSGKTIKAVLRWV